MRQSIKRFSTVDLTGQKVRLRPVRPDDAPTVFDLFRDDRVIRNLAVEAPGSLEEEIEWCRNAATLPQVGSSGVSYHLVIDTAVDSSLAGAVGLHQRGHPHQSLTDDVLIRIIGSP